MYQHSETLKIGKIYKGIREAMGLSQEDVSAGLMSLPQAISVIFGANIGTTMTAQLMAFKISDYIYPIILLDL